MKAAWLLRIASVLALVHGLLHTFGGVFGTVAPGPQAVAITAMQTNRFDVMGVARSYWDFQMGYGLTLTVKFLLETVVFWQLASLIKMDPRVRSVVLTFGLGYLAYTVLAWYYFFAAPAIFELVIAACLLGAWWLAGKSRVA